MKKKGHMLFKDQSRQHEDFEVQDPSFEIEQIEIPGWVHVGWFFGTPMISACLVAVWWFKYVRVAG